MGNQSKSGDARASENTDLVNPDLGVVRGCTPTNLPIFLDMLSMIQKDDVGASCGWLAKYGNGLTRFRRFDFGTVK